MENHLQKNVPQLFAKVLGLAFVYRLADLVGLLQHVAPDALVGLLPVPGAALGGAQIVDKGYEVPEVIALFANKIYHTITPSASSFRLKTAEIATFFIMSPVRALYAGAEPASRPWV